MLFSFQIPDPRSAVTIVKNLAEGFYQFVLIVTDNGGLPAKDTVSVTVFALASINHPPIAMAGPDQVITLPTKSVMLDGSLSADQDHNIISYTWSAISGPASFIITNPAASQTQVNALGEGIYHFELKVTDAGGLIGIDTVQITVNPVPVVISCNNRPQINASLVPVGTLSQARIALVSASAGNKIVFAGGMITGAYSSRVDIYDYLTNTWSTAELSKSERQGMAVATVNNKILFAGGGDNDWGQTTSRVDIYDALNNSWSIAELSKDREYLTATTLGNKVFFAGSGKWEANLVGSAVVDIYDNSTNTWTTASLSEGRMDHSATLVNNKIYFAGGTRGYWTSFNTLKTVDI